MIKKGMIAVFTLMLLFGFASVSAQSDLDSNVDAGTTPDSVVWGIDRALERIELAMTFDKSEKENKRLEHAYERLLEVRQMIEENNLEDAEKAREEHDKLLMTSSDKIEQLDDDIELEEVESLRDSIDAQESEVEDIIVSERVRGTLNDDQRMKLEAFLASLGGNVENVRVIIDAKEDESISRLEMTGRNVSDIALREKRIVRAEVFDDMSVVKIGYRFTTRTVDRDELIKEIIKRFELSDEDVKSMLKIESGDDFDDFDEDRLRIKVDVRERDGLRVSEVNIIMRRGVEVVSDDEIRTAVVRLSRLSESDVIDALNIRERSDNRSSERKIEIESRTRGNFSLSKIEIEWDGLRREIRLPMADRQEIVRSLALMLSTSTDEIERAITKFESESEDGNNDSEDTSQDLSDDDSENDSNDDDSDDSNYDDNGSDPEDDDRSGRDDDSDD